MPEPTHPASRPTTRALLGLVGLIGVVWGGTQWLDQWRDEQLASATREHSQRVDITLYTTSTCPYCARAMAWLQRHSVRWRECNVETDAACLRTFNAQGAPGVPLVQAGERWHLGFDPRWLAEALATQDRPERATQSPSPSGASSPRP